MELQEITEESKVGMKLASALILVTFIFSTAVSVGWILADQASAASAMEKMVVQIKEINDERRQNREKYLGTLSEINSRLARIEEKLD